MIKQPNKLSRLVAVIGSACLIALLGSASSPSPAEAAVITCPISNSVKLPTMSEFSALLDDASGATPGTGPSTGLRRIVSIVSKRCLANLKQGSYAVRAKYTTTLQLSSKWPGGGYSEYYSEAYPNRYEDATWSTSIAVWQPEESVTWQSEWPMDRLSNPIPHRLRSTSAYLTLGYTGATFKYLPLSELCFSEQCKFTNEDFGIFADPSGETLVGIVTEISMCFPYTPRLDTTTIRCRSGHFAHPGTLGMRVVIVGSLQFEPLIVSPLRSSPR